MTQFLQYAELSIQAMLRQPLVASSPSPSPLGPHCRLMTLFTLAAVVACSSDGVGSDIPSLGRGGDGAVAGATVSEAGASGATAGATASGAGASSAFPANAGAPDGGVSGIEGGAGRSSGGGSSLAAAGSSGSVAGYAGTGDAPAGGGSSFGMAGAAGGLGSSTTGCSGKPYKFCEDFEAGQAGDVPTGWTKDKGYGAGSAQDIRLATDQSHSGRMAVKSDSAAKGQGRLQHSLSILGATASKHWGRVFYKVQSPSPAPTKGVFHVTFVGLNHGSGENRVVDVVENTKGKHQWLYNNPDDKGSLGSSYDWAFDSAWHCAEWYVDVNSNAYHFFSDSTAVTSIGFTGKTDAEMADYTSVIVGSTFYQTPPSAYVMWFDDLAIDDNRIGCQ